MNSGAQSVVRDGRRTARQPAGNAMNTTALLGANIAFNAHSAQRRSQVSAQNTGETASMPPKTDPRRPTRRHYEAEDEDQPVSEMPEAGIVMNRIKTFSGSGGNNVTRPTVPNKKSGDFLRPEPPQIQAAALAAMRSASRTPQTTITSSRSTSPIKRAMTGSSPSRRQAISPAPKPDFLSARDSRPLHAPSPIRKTPIIAHSLANITNDGSAGSRIQQSQNTQHDLVKSSVLNATTNNKSKLKDVINSSPDTESSISPHRKILGSHLNKDRSKLAPPIAKPKPAASSIEEKALQRELSLRSIPRLEDDAPPSPRRIPPRTRDASRSDTATMNSSYTQSTSDEAPVFSGLHSNTISRQDTGNADSTSGMTKESLADAIIASSLASSRAPSPYSPSPPVPPPRRSRSHSLLHPGDILRKEVRTTPSPPKGLRQTLRDPPKSDDEVNKNSNRRHLIKHHPHKHHEGDRRRWRQEVTETARKRYEGVWAANKGICVPPAGFLYQIFPDLPRTLVLQDLVVHLVVRDIWVRSRLPSHTLEQIWDLVDSRKIGMLAREEFVVGLWLIDETLRGHKIPVKVPDSVWDSVRYSPGIKLPQELR